MLPAHTQPQPSHAYARPRMGKFEGLAAGAEALGDVLSAVRSFRGLANWYVPGQGLRWKRILRDVAPPVLIVGGLVVAGIWTVRRMTREET